MYIVPAEEAYSTAKEPCIIAKEPCITAKEPYIIYVYCSCRGSLQHCKRALQH